MTSLENIETRAVPAVRGPRRAQRPVDAVPAWLTIIGIIVALFLVLPTLIVIPMSFSESTTFQFPPVGFTWHLYSNFFTNPAWLQSLGNSVLVAALTAVVATLCGTAAALGLNRLHGRAANAIRTLLMIPLVTPAIVVATAVYITFLQWHLTGTLIGFVLAHTAISLPFVLVNVTAALGSLDPVLLRASTSLGAPPSRTFLRVTAPLISRGILTGAIFAFITSFDEVVIAVFIHSPTFQTLPVQMYNSVTSEIDPTISAASSLIVVVVTLAFLAPQVFRRKKKPALKSPAAATAP
ncbi:ABC transporter permease [Lacisediminihabitans profunda]|uniref:ABC transporter permease n=1 Tax=Lacisediminihabitans profunda TaxID=2594790 RepID=A0A5C8UNW2_9MICO|nr:ABC transporter permease [Lacisediminihabitans profunda]TXN29988.1 ABC transporter permease [Lacisediminihabitans profunda]